MLGNADNRYKGVGVLQLSESEKIETAIDHAPSALQRKSYTLIEAFGIHSVEDNQRVYIHSPAFTHASEPIRTMTVEIAASAGDTCVPFSPEFIQHLEARRHTIPYGRTAAGLTLYVDIHLPDRTCLSGQSQVPVLVSYHGGGEGTPPTGHCRSALIMGK